METSKIFREGYMAYTCGLNYNDNPYNQKEQPSLYKEWKSGWKACKFDEEHLVLV
jgi:ribosome modulation factor